MKTKKLHRLYKNAAITAGIFAVAIAVCLPLSLMNVDNTYFIVPVFILAVTLVARFTDGYVYGMAASFASVFCVNYIFTYPFWQFNLSISGYPLTFAAMLFVSVIISSLTTQIKEQEQLKFEVEKEKMHANLLRAISHDIRTPLASILGTSSTILQNEDLPVSERNELLLEINRQSQWLVRTTENLLSLTRFTGSVVTLKKTDEVLEEIIGSAILKFRKNCGDLPIKVSMPDTIMLVPMDAMLIEQVLINIFDNVSVHAPTATRIFLRISHEPDRVVIMVEDDGQGIAPAKLKHIFDGYIPGDSAVRTGERHNMGIGLSVCKSIIGAHGGEMTAENNDYGGATFRFWLPLSEDANEF
jgi:two-component system sensor histidine kinase KdpD